MNTSTPHDKPILLQKIDHATDLKNTGLKVTLPRLKILETFQKNKHSNRHMSAEDVYKILMQDDMDVGLATVYRVLMQFEEAGILIRNAFDGDKSFYELNHGEHHDHLVCLDCGRVEEFYDDSIEERQHTIAKERGFAIANHALSLYVNCTKPNCTYKST